MAASVAVFAAPAGAVWNGTSATADAPWAVRTTATVTNGTTSCSGSIISRHFVLTAAHCLGTNMQVHGVFPTGSAVLNASLAWSGGWNCTSGGVDVALIQTATDLSTLAPQPLPLAPSTAIDAALVGQGVTAFGWGDTGDESLVAWHPVTGECGGSAPASFVLATSPQETRSGAYTVDSPCPADNISGLICFSKSAADLSRIGVGDSGGPWVASYGGSSLQIAVTHGTFDDRGSEIDGTSVAAVRSAILAQTQGEVLAPAAQTILRDKASGSAWLVGSDGFRRSIATNAVFTCLQATGQAPVVDASLFDIETVPELVGSQASCSSPPPAPEPAPPGGGGGGGGGSSGTPPDLHVDVSSSSASAPAVGSELDFTITVSSANTGGSSSVRLDVNLPAGYTVTKIDRDRGPGCTGTPPTLSCDAAWINPSAATHIWISGTVGRTGEQDITATARSLLEPEFDPKDNTATLKLQPSTPLAATTPPPKALQGPRLSGTGRPGSVLHLVPARWSSTPARVSYRWELCSGSRCAAIGSATGTTLRIVRAYGGRSIRVVAIAAFEGTRVTASSSRVAVKVRA